jgi:hypothetical protein
VKVVTSDTTAAWHAQYKGGILKPMMRATIQKLNDEPMLVDYDLANAGPGRAPFITITNVSSDGTTVTYTTLTAHGFPAGKSVTMSGINPSAYNLANAVIASVPTLTTFTVTNSATGAFVTGGTATLLDRGWNTVDMKGYQVPITGKGQYCSLIFGHSSSPIELPNIKSMTWQRNVDSEIATATLVLWNTETLAIGAIPPNAYDFDQPGYFTFTRGDTASNTRWGYTENEWRDYLVPDRVIRTYEGYGFDAAASPAQDVHLYQSGVWMIDDVDYTHDGLITVTMRDIGRALIDQILFPEVVPVAHWPLYWDMFQNVGGVDVLHPKYEIPGLSYIWPSYLRDSNQLYEGLGLVDGATPYAGTGSKVAHNGGAHAFDSDDNSFWVSVGSRQAAHGAIEFIEATTTSAGVAVTAVKTKAWSGPYTCFVSLHSVSKGWLGATNVPYVAQTIDGDLLGIGAKIPYVASKIVPLNKTAEIVIPDVWAAVTDVDKIRLSFTNFHKMYPDGSYYGKYYPYRVGIREITYSSTAKESLSDIFRTGNYGDYTHIIKWFLAWAGWYWPDNAAQAFIRDIASVGNTGVGAAPTPDDILSRGRVWGDFMDSMAPGNADGLVVAKMGPDVWDRKPILDGIKFIRDLVAFNFYIDETGGAIFRAPNIWGFGNYLSLADGAHPVDRKSLVITNVTSDGTTVTYATLAPHGLSAGEVVITTGIAPLVYNFATATIASAPTATTFTVTNPAIGAFVSGGLVTLASGRTTDMVTIDETETLLNLAAKLSSRSSREQIFIANVSGNFGATINGYVRVPSGQRRVAGWTDVHFNSNADAVVMAELIGIRQLMDYRTDTVVIPGNPSIQIDDQVRIYERVSGETFVHYVSAITSSWDALTGKWIYTLTTSWLGDESSWSINTGSSGPGHLQDVTRTYLAAVGAIHV